MNTLFLRFATVACVAMIAACATTQAPSPSAPPPATPAPPPSASPAQKPLPNVNLSGYKPAFKEGFRDGCESFRGTYRRDNARFGSDTDYAIGWQDGFSICRRQGK